MGAARRLLDNIGKSLALVPRGLRFDADGRFYLYRYGRNGTFDYQRYRDIQIAGNKRKLTRVWAEQEVIDAIADFLRERRPGLTRGLCHGSRNGTEVTWFRERFGAGVEVIGTDISDTATQFPHLVQWDFHERREEWVGCISGLSSSRACRAWAGRALRVGRRVVAAGPCGRRAPGPGHGVRRRPAARR